MPHDTRHTPNGCPPNCPTRLAAELSADDSPPTEAATSEAQAVAMFADAGLDPEVLVETADVIDTMEDEPVLPGEPERMVSDPQRKRMAVEMRKAGIVDRSKRLDYVSRVIGRRVESGNELTVGEASHVIRALVDDATERGLNDVQPTEGES